MRVLVAPAEFKGSLTANGAASAIANGWLSQRPRDELDLCPLSDGGPGFIDALSAALGGRLASVTLRGPHREDVPGAVLMVETTAYIESAQACGIHLVDVPTHDATRASTVGVGDLMRTALNAGATKIVVGLGGSATTDGGAGMLAALGATADTTLTAGGGGLRGISTVDLDPVRELFSDVELIAATDVDSPLLGLTGTAKSFATQKGASDEEVFALDAALADFAKAIGRRPDGKDPAVARGAGAAGGLGYALAHLGAKRVAGIATVAEAVGLTSRIQATDLVVTGEGCFDWQSMRGKVVTGVAQRALPSLRPCVVIAGEVLVGRREYSALGVSSAYAISEIVGSKEHSLSEPVSSLEEAAARVARTWGGGHADLIC